MKKTLIAAAAAVALTASAAAEITFGAWLRVLPTLAASDGDDTFVGMENSWGYGARSARLDINAVAEDGNAGMTMHVFNDAYDGIAGDAAYMWVKPVEQVKLTVGRLDNNTGLRGDFCYGSWNWIRSNVWLYNGEGFSFSAPDPNGLMSRGLLAEVFPVEGLQIFVGVPFYATGDTTGLCVNYAEDAYKNLNAGFAYTIDGVGKLKAQYIGQGQREIKNAAGVVTQKANSDCTIEAAFDLTAVENLFATAGFAFYNKDTNGDYQTMKVAVGVSYQVTEEAKIYADFQYKAYDKADAAMSFGAGVDYNIGDGLALNADVRAMLTGEKDNAATKKDESAATLSFLVGVTKNVSSNGLVGIGFQGTTNGNGMTGLTGKEDKLSWAIPLTISTWF